MTRERTRDPLRPPQCGPKGGMDMENRKILSRLRRLVSTHGTHDPYELAEAMGIQVRLIHMQELRGFCVQVMKQYFIFIRDDMSEQMQRMCCAHELAHVVLHKEYLAKEPGRLNMALYDGNSRTEYEANLFSAFLLIDSGELTDCLRSGMDLASVASTLDVNVNLVALRLSAPQTAGRAVDLPFTPDRRFLGRIADRSDSV